MILKCKYVRYLHFKLYIYFINSIFILRTHSGFSIGPSRLGVLRCQRETNRDAGSLECVRTFGDSQPVGRGSVKVKINDFNISPIRWL